jgi:hypothetical protein
MVQQRNTTFRGMDSVGPFSILKQNSAVALAEMEAGAAEPGELKLLG